MKICPKCGVSHQKTGKFCSRSCANSRTWTTSVNEKRAISNKKAASQMDPTIVHDRVKLGHRYQGPYCKIKWLNCSHCGVGFWASTHKEHYTTCSDVCFLAVKRKNRAGKKVFYNGEWYDSNWEVEMVKWFIDINIKYERVNTGIPWIDSKGKHRQCYPDFYIPSLDLYVDPKNKFCIQDQKEKLNYVSTRINLIYGAIPDIQKKILELY